MKKIKTLISFAICILFASSGNAKVLQDTIPEILVYKKVDTLQLKLHVYKPAGFKTSKEYPAIVFFFGGGWINGNIGQFKKQALYLAAKGMVAILADYRVKSRNGTSPFDAVTDGKSAIRYVRSNAKALHINPERIAAAGGSAGGHVAAAADLTSLDEAGEDLGISSRPNALVLFNPVFNNGPGEYGHERIGDRYPEISPFHNIKKGAAPSLVMLGTKDKLVSVKTAEACQAKMKEVGSRCDLILYPNEQHGFFNRGEAFDKTLRETEKFLRSIGYLAD